MYYKAVWIIHASIMYLFLTSSTSIYVDAPEELLKWYINRFLKFREGLSPTGFLFP
jgi:hypothetical protein